jgi:hypothetical protein
MLGSFGVARSLARNVYEPACNRIELVRIASKPLLSKSSREGPVVALQSNASPREHRKSPEPGAVNGGKMRQASISWSIHIWTVSSLRTRLSALAPRQAHLLARIHRKLNRDILGPSVAQHGHCRCHLADGAGLCPRLARSCHPPRWSYGLCVHLVGVGCRCTRW